MPRILRPEQVVSAFGELELKVGGMEPANSSQEYLLPENGKQCEDGAEEDCQAFRQRLHQRFPKVVYALDFSWWKKPIVRRLFQGSKVRFVRKVDRVPAGATLAVWGRKAINGTLAKEVSLVHLEDGFIRSIGLGADLIRPLSWVMDSRGIYYDATQPSDLEHLLLTAAFSPALVERGARLQRRIVESGITKYNVGKVGWKRPAGSRRVILVPGQVENDASIRYGAPGIRTNIALLQTVREANPDAYVVYKPHPDVLAGLRAMGDGENGAFAWCDEVVMEVSMANMLTLVDEVHVLTSLAGFEALLRGRAVTTYGQPFYAGWGLTCDMAPIPRRTRHLTLSELVAGVLILYPTYINRATGCFTTPEQALDELLAWRETAGDRLPLWRRILRPFLRLTSGNG
jgi:capsular polysaccharide export protein